jgi:hypothetical protein
MSRKKLITIGCSFTRDILSFSHVSRGVFENSSRGVFKPGYDFPVWPTLLAEKLDMDCLNLGRGGMGNDYISAKLVDTVLSEKKEDIGLVVLMWSGWQRIDYQDIDGVWEKMVRRGDAWNNILKYNNAHNATTKSLRYFLMSQMLLKDIPYLMIQGVDVQYKLAAEQGNVTAELKWPQIFLNSKIFDEIDEKKFIGWPIMREIGGYNVIDMLDKLDPERTQLRISKEDHHPNAEGNKIIAQEIYNAYEKVYI